MIQQQQWHQLMEYDDEEKSAVAMPVPVPG